MDIHMYTNLTYFLIWTYHTWLHVHILYYEYIKYICLQDLNWNKYKKINLRFLILKHAPNEMQFYINWQELFFNFHYIQYTLYM